MPRNVFLAAIFVVLTALTAAATADTAGATAGSSLSGAVAMPASFIENRGQWDPDVRFLLPGRGARVALTGHGPVFRLDGQADLLTASFRGANAVLPEGLEASAAKVSFYRGSDPSRWVSGASTFSKVIYRGLYDGVDFVASAGRGSVKYEFRLAPGAAADRIVIDYSGVDGLSIDADGRLRIAAARGEMVDAAPVAYQDTADGRREVKAAFRLVDASSYGFEITGPVDSSLPLVIDPEIEWSTLMGGVDDDSAHGAAFDADKNLYVTGWTTSSDFPASGGSGVANDLPEAFVAKITPDRQLAWATFIGGTDADWAWNVAVDQSGNPWIVGHTYSDDLPVPGGFDTTFGAATMNSGDAFIARLTPAGQLSWASYLGGSLDDNCGCIAIDQSGDVWVGGQSESPDFPVPGAFQAAHANGSQQTDGVIARISSDGSLEWASFYGGTNWDSVLAIAVDGAGDIWVGGHTSSADLAVPGAADSTMEGQADGFVSRITAAGALAWGTYIGGSEWDVVYGMDFDPQGNLWLAGQTLSDDFPTPNGFDTTFNGAAGKSDAYIARMDPAGQLLMGSFLGGKDWDGGNAIASDSEGNAWIVGETFSKDFPALGGRKSPNAGGADAFMARVTASGELVRCTTFGGKANDAAYGIAIDSSDAVWVVGGTKSDNFPAVGGFDTSAAGGIDAFVLKAGEVQSGFTYGGPDTGITVAPDQPPTFTFAVGDDVKPALISFSSLNTFPQRPVKRPDKRVDKTVRYRLRPGATSWTPSAGQWKNIKRLALDGVVYWRLEGKSAASGYLYGQTRVFGFNTGSVTDPSVSGSHDLGGLEAVWPGSTPPVFTWTDGTNGMASFVVELSADDDFPMADRKRTLTVGARSVNNGSYQLTDAEWLKVKRLASAAGGTLWWRVKAIDRDKALSITSDAKQLAVDGGQWSLGDLALDSTDTTLEWTHDGEGLSLYSVELSVDDTFAPSARYTLRVPPKGVPGDSYTFTDSDIARLASFADKNGVATLHVRVRGEDESKAFVTWSPSMTTAAP